MSKIDVLKIFQQSFLIPLKNWKLIYPFILPLTVGIALFLFSLFFSFIDTGVDITTVLNMLSNFQNDIWIYVFLLGLMVFSLWLSMIGVGGIISAVEKVRKKQKTSSIEILKQSHEAWSQSYKNSWRLLIAYSLEQFFLMMGLLLFIIPGIFLAVRLSLVVPACILEKKGYGIKRSWNATKGNFWKIFLILLIWNGVFIIIGNLPYLFVFAIFLLPIYLTTLTLLYIQLKKVKQ